MQPRANAKVARGRNYHTPASKLGPHHNLGFHHGEESSMLCLLPDPSHDPPHACFVPEKAQVPRTWGNWAPTGPLVVSTGTGQASAHVPHPGWHSDFTGSPGAATVRLGPKGAF